MLVLYVVFFILIYTRIQKKLRISRFLVLFYLISSLCSVYLFYCTDLYPGRVVSLESVAYYCGIFLLFILGVISIERSFKPLDNSVMNEKIILLFSYFLIVISLISFIYSFSRLSSDQLGSLDKVTQIRDDYNVNSANNENQSIGLLGYIVGPANVLNGVKIFLFFYLINFFRYKHTKLAYLLLICSLTSVVENLTIVGRNATMHWLILLMLNYTLFSAYLHLSLKRKLKRLFYCILPLLLLPIIFITIARFATERDAGMLKGFISSFNSVIDYFGQGFINFSYIYDYAFNFDFYGKFTFPVFWGSEALGHYEMNNMPYFRYALISLNSFYSFVGSFYMDFGFWGTILLSLSFYLLFKCISKISSGNLPSVLLLIFSFEFLFMGIFYFMHWAPMFQKMYVFAIFWCVYEKIAEKKRSRIYYYRKDTSIVRRC